MEKFSLLPKKGINFMKILNLNLPKRNTLFPVTFKKKKERNT